MIGDLCQKKIRFGCVLLVFCFLFGVLFVGSPANALVIQDGSALVLTDGFIKTSSGDINAVVSGSDLIFYVNNATDVNVTGLYFNFNTSSGFEPNYLMSLNVRYEGNNSNNSGYMLVDGLLSEKMDTITTSCVDVSNNNFFNPSGGIYAPGNNTVTCTYLFLSHGNYSYFSSRLDSRIVRFVNPDPSSQPAKIVVTPGFIRHFSTDGLTPSDRQWLESVIPQGTTIQQVEEGVENALHTQSEAERDELSDAQDDAEDTADAQGSQAQSRGTTILQAFISFVNALRNVTPSNCNIDMDLGNLDLGVVNLCSLSPPAEFQAISSILLIGFCVPLSISTARKIIALFRSFQT